MTILTVEPQKPARAGNWTAVREIVEAVGRFSMWGPLALDDVVGRYRRTIFGPLWIIIPQALFIFGIYVLHESSFGGTSKEFLPYLAVSLPLWVMLVAFLVEGSLSMVSAKGLMESYALPPALHVIRPVARAYVTFAHLLPVYIVVELWVNHGLPVTMLAAIPAFALIGVFGFGAGLALAPLGARFRDLPPALQALTTLGFVLTPVFWVPSTAQKANLLVKLNPFYYLLEMLRAPFLGTWGDPAVWAIAAAISVGVFVAGVIIYAWRRSTVIFWL